MTKTLPDMYVAIHQLARSEEEENDREELLDKLVDSIEKIIKEYREKSGKEFTVDYDLSIMPDY